MRLCGSKEDAFEGSFAAAKRAAKMIVLNREDPAVLDKRFLDLKASLRRGGARSFGL